LDDTSKNESLIDKLADTIPTTTATTTETFSINMLIGTLISYNTRKMDLGNALFLFQSKLGWIFVGSIAKKHR